MSFKVGDVCIVTGGAPSKSKYIGEECTITRIGGFESGIDDCCIFVPACPSDHPSGEWTAMFKHLRKKQPPNSEFQPAEPEFVSDLLKRLGRVSA